MKLDEVLVQEDFRIKDASASVRRLVSSIVRGAKGKDSKNAVSDGVKKWDKAGFSQSHIEQKGSGGKKKKPSFLNGKKSKKKSKK